MIRYIVVAGFAALALCSSASAQAPLASHDGLTASLYPDTGCQQVKGSPVQIKVEADPPHKFFSQERLEKLAAATRIALNFECGNYSHITLNGEHNGYKLDYVSVNAPKYQVFLGGEAKLYDPLWQTAKREAGAQPTNALTMSRLGGSGSALLNSSSGTSLASRKFFYKQILAIFMRFGADQAFTSLGANGLRYTTMSEFLVGEHYLFYPYTVNDTHNTALQPPAPGTNPEYGLSILASGVTVQGNGGVETVTYNNTPQTPGAFTNLRPECFQSSLFPSGSPRTFKDGYCFTILENEVSGGFQYYLGSVFVSTNKITGKYFNLAILGRLEPTDANGLRAALKGSANAVAALEAADAQAVAQGKPKPSLRITYVEPEIRPYFQNLYDGPATPSTAAIDDMDIRDRNMFLIYHQLYEKHCLRPDEPTRRFTKTSTRYVGEETHGNLTTVYYEEYIAVDVQVRKYAYDRFSEIGKRMMGDIIATVTSYVAAGDIDFPTAFEVFTQPIARRGTALNDIILTEGCHTPTLNKLERAIDAQAGVRR